MAGLVAGACRMGIHFSYPNPQCGNPKEDVRPDVFTDVHYLHFALILGAIVLFVTVCVSFVTAPRTEKQVSRTSKKGEINEHRQHNERWCAPWMKPK